MISSHPTDQVIRDLVAMHRLATMDEVVRIIERLATAPFDDRDTPVATPHRGVVYLGQLLGSRANALFYHLVKRVLVDEQWAEGTTADRYLGDLRQAARAPEARLVVYRRRSGAMAALLAPNDLPPSHLGPKAQPCIYLPCSADRVAPH